MKSSDYQVLQKMVPFCKGITELLNRYDRKFSLVLKNYENLILFSMYIMQIGRQCTFLSEEFKANYNKIGWNDLIDLSNIIFTDFLSLNIQNLGKISRHNIFKINKIIKDSESINIFEFE